MSRLHDHLTGKAKREEQKKKKKDWTDDLPPELKRLI